MEAGGMAENSRNEDKEDKVGTSIKLPRELMEEIDRIASEENRDRTGQITYFLRRALREYKQTGVQSITGDKNTQIQAGGDVKNNTKA
jgi:predicted transcriptional regulator